MSVLNQKIVWISGASSGIGEYLARAMYDRGARVILSARRAERLQKLSDELGANSAVLVMDVTETERLKALHQKAERFFGPIDILVNNAGISQRGNVGETSLEVDRKLFEVNYFGNIALTKAVLPSMVERQTGRIVVISSVAGKLGVPFRSSYCASKHALQGYYDALRAEVADRNIQVHMICPGYIRTDISYHALGPQGQKHGVMDQNQKQGMAPDRCAELIIKAIRKNKKEVYIGGIESKAVLVRRFFPGLYYRLIEKRARERRF